MMYQDLACSMCDRKFRRQHSVQQHENATRGRCKLDKYLVVSASDERNKQLRQFHDEKANLCVGSRRRSKGLVQDFLDRILNSKENRDRYETTAILEGSYKTGLKIGKPDEFDFSVGLRLPHPPRINDSQEVPFQYSGDDIDGGTSPVKRLLFDRMVENTEYTEPPVGYKVVRMKQKRTSKFSDSVIHGSLVPYEVLKNFHQFVSGAVWNMDTNMDVTVAKHARGPAISVFIKDDGIVHRISVDITPVVYVGNAGPRLRHSQWPRPATMNWLSEEKIDAVKNTEIYLVPKGDKFWKVSFARCEDELLKNIDGRGVDGTRKMCLRICKMKLKQWKSKSENGMKAISSYMLKTVMLWLCEFLPDEADWSEDKLSARYLNAMMELQLCLKRRKLGEYFIPEINLLDGKDDNDINEMIQFIEEEIQSMRD